MTDKTIRMPKELLAKWLAALRSGEYKQGVSMLHNKYENEYCCLGVLQVVASGVHEMDETGRSLNLPSRPWLEKRDITFLWPDDDFPQKAPWLPTFNLTASKANDYGIPFAEIADAIEACAEGV